MAQILAYQGKFSDASKTFVQNSAGRKAVEMYVDLKQWDYAKQLVQSTGVMPMAELMKIQAIWAEESGDVAAAVDLCVGAGEYMKAIQIYGEKGWHDHLMGLCRDLDK
jgi:intraflagellar transport protein 122